MNYVDKIRQLLVQVVPNDHDALVDLFTLLVLTRGSAVTASDIHDAVSVWSNMYDRDCPNLIPFKFISDSLKERERQYLLAVQAVAKATDG